ncbi:hypothetical protein [Rhizobium sp. NFR07]|uniref:hypothetical protein n=1 Tax=Rhizobium sp. NFR07 TaxID=1566262 RepID=UPI00116033F4|nr:hypothetical protein [Rhizobium sp. NFR07]
MTPLKSNFNEPRDPAERTGRGSPDCASDRRRCMRPVTPRLIRIVIRNGMFDVTTLTSDMQTNKEFGASCGNGGKKVADRVMWADRCAAHGSQLLPLVELSPSSIFALIAIDFRSVKPKSATSLDLSPMKLMKEEGFVHCGAGLPRHPLSLSTTALFLLEAAGSTWPTG